MTYIIKRQCAHLYIYKSIKIGKHLYIKSQTLYTKQDNLCYVFVYKKHDTFRYTIFHENFEVGIYIQKAWHFSVREFFIYKSQTLRKNQDNLSYVLYTKIWTLCVTRSSLDF